jgi:hypothetical protein
VSDFLNDVKTAESANIQGFQQGQYDFLVKDFFDGVGGIGILL